MYGDKPQPGTEGYELMNPTADVGRLLNFGEETTPSGRTEPISSVRETTSARLSARR